MFPLVARGASSAKAHYPKENQMIATTTTTEHTEIEAALAIISDPEGFSRRIAEMSVGCPSASFLLKQRPTRDFHNTYLDTSGGALDVGQFTFRVRRRSNGKQRMTVKGPPQIGRNGVVSRLEIQADVRYDGLLELLSQMGLRIVQEQTVRREAYNILDRLDPSLPMLAELAIDAVEYAVRGRTVRFHEVEIENKGDDSGHVEDAVDWLLQEFGDQLRVWEYNKLATGRAIEELADDLQFAENGDLTPAAYDQVEGHLSQEEKDEDDEHHQAHKP